MTSILDLQPLEIRSFPIKTGERKTETHSLVCLVVCLFVWLFGCLSVCLSVCPSVRPSVRLSVCLSHPKVIWFVCVGSWLFMGIRDTKSFRSSTDQRTCPPSFPLDRIQQQSRRTTWLTATNRDTQATLDAEKFSEYFDNVWKPQHFL